MTSSQPAPNSSDTADRRRFAVFGEIYSPNIGDGIIFECLKWGLESQGIEVRPCDISLRSGYADAVQNERVGDDSVGPLRKFARYFVRRSLALRRAITVAKWYGGGRRRFVARFEHEIRKADAVVIGGGQILVDRQLGFPLPIATIVGLARKHGKKIAVFSCGADRQQGMIARGIFRRMARAAAYISVRDAQSKEFLLSLDPGLDVHVCPDIGFLTSSVFPADGPGPENVAGVNIMPHATLAAFARPGQAGSPDQYLETWKSLVHALLDEGWLVHIMTNGDPRDGQAARDLYRAFADDDRVTLVPPPARPEDLARQMQGVTALIASRMHAGIVAYSYGRTVVPIVWDRKTIGVWALVDPSINPVEYFAQGLAGLEIASLKDASNSGTGSRVVAEVRQRAAIESVLKLSGI